MAKFIARRFFTIPIIYIIIIIGIFMLQFTTGTVFSYTFGGLKISGSYQKTESGSGDLESPLSISFKGVDIILDDVTPLFAQKDGIPQRLLPQKLVTSDRSMTLIFPQDVLVTFTSKISENDPNDEILCITADFPTKTIQSVIMSYRISNRAFEENEDGIRRISYDNLSYAFAGSVNQDAKQLIFTGKIPQVTYARYVPFQGIDLAKVSASLLADQGMYVHNKYAFRTAARETLHASLSGLYTEDGVVAYIAESALCGEYRSAIDAVPVAFSKGTSRSYLSNPFLDSLMRTHETLVSKNKTDVAKIRQLIADKDVTVFEIENLVPFIIDHMGRGMFTSLKAVLENSDIQELTPLQSSGILQTAVQGAVYYPQWLETVNSLLPQCLTILFDSFVKAGDGLFLSSDGETVSVRDSLRISRILTEYGSTYSDSEWEAAGRALFNSIVPFMHDKGGFPVRLTFITGSDGVTRSGVIPEAGTSIPPDLLYPLIVDNSYYPHEVCLLNQGFVGMWAWSSAESITMRKVSSILTEIDVAFINGETHYMTLCGVKPFTRIQLYDMDFRTDARFESYNSSGYVYNPNTQTLYLKMRHKSPVETIRLYYEPVVTPDPNMQDLHTSPTASDGSKDLTPAVPAQSEIQQSSPADSAPVQNSHPYAPYL